mgnify:CR=1 FL=1|tara:strand:- start:416 stop:820 length:405 start_codon:yes stop_codon:yes gene_type:complete
MSISKCRLINIPEFKDHRGALSFIEGGITIPFEIKRIYYLYKVPNKEDRGNHAHKEMEQLIIPISGSFKIDLNDGKNKKEFLLNKPSKGLYLCPMIWRKLYDFSKDATCLVLSSTVFDEGDYYRSYNEFLKDVK